MTTGIYRIYNTKTGDSYVGQSLDINRRLQEHYRTLNSLVYKHHSSKLQEDWDKFGEESFKAEVLEVCPESVLEAREKYWINFYNSAENGYNVRYCYNQPIKEELDRAIGFLEGLKERL